MNTALPVVETFHSIQGEGKHAGRSAFFIRLAGCKVGCPWCDTKISWDESLFPKKSIKEIASQAKEAIVNGAAFIVITGGEPLHHNLDSLFQEIRKISKYTFNKEIPLHIETSGVNKITGNPNWITLSPKRHSIPTKEILERCDEIKVVIHQQEDILFAEEMAQKAIDLQAGINNKSLSLQPMLFLQPGWDSKQGMELAIAHVKSNSHWKLSIQAHKWLGIQ